VRVVERRFEAGVDESCCEVELEYWEVMHDEGVGVSWEICVAGGSGGRSGGGDDIAGACCCRGVSMKWIVCCFGAILS